MIRNGALLLVGGKGRAFFWTPGGTVEKGESPETALRRELAEELSIKAEKMLFFKEYCETIPESKYGNSEIKLLYFLVDFSGTVKPNGEIGRFVWLSAADYKSKKFELSETLKNKIVPALLQAGHIK